MGLLDRLMDTGKSLKPELRAALLAECGERVFPLYENYWIGTYSEEVKKTLDMIWSFALGEKIDHDQAKAYREELSDLIQFHLDEEECAILANSVSVITYGLDSIMADEEEESLLGFARALCKTTEAATSAEYMADRVKPMPGRTEVAEEEEEKWQKSAIDLVTNWKGKVERNMFDSLGDKPPKWYLDWKERGYTEVGHVD